MLAYKTVRTKPRMRSGFIAVVFCMVFLAAPVSAGFDIEEYEKLANENSQTKMFTRYDAMALRLIGAYEAIGWVNVLYLEENKPPVFCPPDDFVITWDILREMIDEEIRDHTFSQNPYPREIPLEAIVMFASMTRFPCP